MLCGVAGAYAQTTPRYAASTQTWVFGAQTWSDVIHIPACDKQDFDGGTKDAPKADCRTYTHEGETWYYYSWPYVNEHAGLLCPSPWRVPADEDFSNFLEDITTVDRTIDWRHGGYVYGGVVEDMSFGYYWSSTVNDAHAYGLYYFGSYPGVRNYSQSIGFQVRCVARPI
jgi:hypothetical protein